MIYVNSVSNSIFTTLSSDSIVVNSGINICLNDIINTNPNITPWIGIYYDSTNIDPYRANTTKPWMATHNFVVYSQVIGYENAIDNREELDKINTIVLDALNGNRKLDNTVLNMMNINVRPFQIDLENEDTFFMDQINIQYEVFA